MEEQFEVGPSRRNLITGIAAAGVGVPLLAACGASPSPNFAAQSPGGTPSKAAPSTGGSTSLTPLVKTADVPVGGGVILSQAVVTQPTAGVFKAFSPTCTHQGCTVGQVQKGSIICPCHGSTFSVADGSVQSGPAPSPLPPISITTKNGEIFAT